MEKNKVVYFHINPLTNEIFYVGIGNVKRPYQFKRRGTGWDEVVKIAGVIVDIIEEGLSWQEACERERFYIKRIGRKDLNKGPLVNLTDGGEHPGIVSEKTKYKLSESHKGIKLSQSAKDKLSKHFTGRKGSPRSQETRDKISKATKGIKLTQEHKDKISITMKKIKNKK